MRCLDRNKRSFYYATYTGKTMGTSGNYKTGENTVTYSNPIAATGNISAARGNAEIEMFGASLNYDKTIALSKPLFDEYAVLWVDVTPQLDAQGQTTTPYDYVVVRKAVSLNSVLYAIRKVEVRRV